MSLSNNTYQHPFIPWTTSGDHLCERRVPAMGDAIEKQDDKKRSWRLLRNLYKPSSCLSLKYPHHGKEISQHQHEPKVAIPLGGPFESEELVNGSASTPSTLQASHAYPSKVGNLVIHHMSLDTDFFKGRTLLLDCHKFISGKVNESGNYSLETLISLCINQPGGGGTPWTLILSIEPADVCELTCNQSLEKVKLNEYTIILRVPLAYLFAFTEVVANEIFEKFQLHRNEGIRLVHLLGQRFCVTTINGEKPVDLEGTELPGEVIWKLQCQKITEIVWEIFKSKEDYMSRSDKGQGWSSGSQGAKQFTQAGSGCRGHGEVSTSRQGRKALGSSFQKMQLSKRRKY